MKFVFEEWFSRMIPIKQIFFLVLENGHIIPFISSEEFVDIYDYCIYMAEGWGHNNVFIKSKPVIKISFCYKSMKIICVIKMEKKNPNKQTNKQTNEASRFYTIVGLPLVLVLFEMPSTRQYEV